MASRAKTTIDIVTGATMGIGRAIAESIVVSGIAKHQQKPQHEQQDARDYALILVGRNEQRGKLAAEALNKQTKSSCVFFEACELNDFQQVLGLKRRIAQRFNDRNGDSFRVNCLVNCAAECPQSQTLVEHKTTDGSTETLDKQFATNVLGYHFMMKVFQDHLQHSYVVNVASNWAGDLYFDDLHFQRRQYDNDSAYRQSKQCNRVLTAAWSDVLFESTGTKVNSCHPGDPCTTLSKDLGYNLWASPPSKRMIESDGTIPFLCGYGKTQLTATGGWSDGGGDSRQPAPCRFMQRKSDAKKLFDICERYCV